MARKYRPERFWNNVSALRAREKLTPKELSEMLGKSSNFITNASQNFGTPALDTAAQIADLFNVTLESLMYDPIAMEQRKTELLKELEQIEAAIRDMDVEPTCDHQVDNHIVKVIKKTKSISTQKKEVVKMDLSGATLDKFESIEEAARRSGISPQCISHAIKSKSHLSHGFLWKCVD